ncbi:MAG: nitroreductase family deazaflavin-dependent oxidoreductase [Pseudomonadota bacterium]|jgi:F420H(2)-dependent quinone reductase
MAPPKPTGKGFSHFLATRMSSLHVWIYRLSGGKIGGSAFNAPVLLLTTTGHRSGRKRTTPLLYLDLGSEGVAIVGSYGGADRLPAWAVNLQNHPYAQIQIGSNITRVNATTAGAARKAELWPKLVAMYSDYQVYQDRTSRDIPVILLTPAS